jgi:hypothetical protein
MSPPSVTEILLVGGERIRVRGAPAEVQTKILDAARGSIMELAWLDDAESGQPVGLNPVHIVLVSAAAES